MTLIVCAQVGSGLIAYGVCGWMVLSSKAAVGECLAAGVTGQARDIWAESLAAVLALLLASRNGKDGK